MVRKGLETDLLYIMKRSILLITPLQRIPRQSIAAMIIDALHDRNGGEEHALADRESGEHE